MISIELNVDNPHWDLVYSIPSGTVLEKGRRGLYHEMVDSASLVTVQFGCYSWANDSEVVLYCGSFSKDYTRGNFKSNLHGRLHNYLQNHREKESGSKNTNLMVFENVNSLLVSRGVKFQHLVFDTIEIGGESVTFDEYCNDASLVKAVEQLLISSYRRVGQCEWNRS